MSFFRTEELHGGKQRQRGKSSEADGLITMVAFFGEAATGGGRRYYLAGY